MAVWDDVMVHFTWTLQIFSGFLSLVCYSDTFVLHLSVEHLYVQNSYYLSVSPVWCLLSQF